MKYKENTIKKKLNTNKKINSNNLNRINSIE